MMITGFEAKVNDVETQILDNGQTFEHLSDPENTGETSLQDSGEHETFHYRFLTSRAQSEALSLGVGSAGLGSADTRLF